MATIRTEMQEVKDQLTSENMVLGGKLASLEEFKVQKEDLMAKFAKLEKDLESNKMEHKDVIYNLERKAVVDKDRLDFFTTFQAYSNQNISIIMPELFQTTMNKNHDCCS